MKKVYVVGSGCGESSLTREAVEAIGRADVLVGAASVLRPFGSLQKRTVPVYRPDEVRQAIDDGPEQVYAVLVSGDVGFYSAASGLAGVLGHTELSWLPGISCLNAFFARLGRPWQEAALVSAHGRGAAVVDVVRRNALTFCLTGGNVGEIGDRLVAAGFGRVRVTSGENLGLPGERIRTCDADELSTYAFSSLTVLLLENDAWDDRVLSGIADASFRRLPAIPMTKSETRAVALAKLRVDPRGTYYDIGAGTGSVTVEMALAAYRGQVFAVERNDGALPLIEDNLAVFQIGNVTVVPGSAPEALDGLPPADGVFIGGSGGRIGEIIDAVRAKNEQVRIVITAVTLETVTDALRALQAAGLEAEIVQLNAARARKAGSLHLMEAINPITILSAGGSR